MEPNEVMANEEVIETATEEIVKASSGCGFKTAAGFGFGILVGVAICKLAKPIMARIKARTTATECIVNVEAEEIGFGETGEESEKCSDE